MKGNLVRFVTLFISFVMVDDLASAHHVIAAKFDPNKSVTLRGTVSKIDWLNPHVHIFIDVQDGRATTWAVELESQVDLQRSGWNRETVKVGDAITVQGISARDGSTQVWGNSVVVASTGKKVFTLAPAQPRRDNQASRPTPRWPDGKPRLGPPPGERGYWGNPSLTALMQTGANVEMEEWAFGSYFIAVGSKE